MFIHINENRKTTTAEVILPASYTHTHTNKNTHIDTHTHNGSLKSLLLNFHS